MDKLYRKVMCSDRLPEKDGMYDTEVGLNLYEKDGWTVYRGDDNPPDWWFEEVPMPTDEDIKKAASDHEKSESMGYSDNISGMYKNIDFESGSRFVIDKLFNKRSY